MFIHYLVQIYLLKTVSHKLLNSFPVHFIWNLFSILSFMKKIPKYDLMDSWISKCSFMLYCLFHIADFLCGFWLQILKNYPYKETSLPHKPSLFFQGMLSYDHCLPWKYHDHLLWQHFFLVFKYVKSGDTLYGQVIYSLV